MACLVGKRLRAPRARNLILAFKNTAQRDIVSVSLPVLSTNSVRNLDASVPPKIIIQRIYSV